MTRRGLGTFVTEDEAMIRSMREEMAVQAVNRFLEEIAGLGLDRKDAVNLIRKEEMEDDHK